MVLRNQSVDLWFDDRVTFTYHSTIGVGANAPAIKAGEWQICCHQGAAYGLDEGGWFSRAMALFSALPPFLLDSAGRPIMSYGFGPANSVAVLYWRLLWSAEVTTPGIAARLIDRTTYLSHVHAARDL